ncbi:equisetin n-methyltransferase [Apiospora arundinis]|uniref:Equisetin n-methyltransferase n=1 Tax=Apiospora arundinis TaxID=335852 RepID=A0ABR2IS65_9PEZI
MAAEFSLAETPIGKYFASMAEMGVMRVFVEHGIFDAIPDEGISLEDLTTKLAVEYNLIERMAAFLLSVGVLTSPAPGHVAHTPASKAFTDPRVAQFYSYLFDFFMGPTTRWPDYFAVNGLAEPARSNRSPGGFALGMPDKTAYEIMAAIPGLATRMNGAMAIDGDIPVTGVYDFSWVAAYAAENTGGESRELIVDVAGGKGQALKDILEETPAIPAARCVLQDQPHVIAEAVAEHEGSAVLGPVKKIGHSIFGEQPTKGALVYYIRRVLNDWSDHEALQILKNVRAACAEDSRVLIAEYLRPAQPSVYTSTVDMFILNIGGKVRSEKAFEELAAKAGLRIASVARHEKTESAVVEMVPI